MTKGYVSFPPAKYPPSKLGRAFYQRVTKIFEDKTIEKIVLKRMDKKDIEGYEHIDRGVRLNIHRGKKYRVEGVTILNLPKPNIP